MQTVDEIEVACTPRQAAQLDTGILRFLRRRKALIVAVLLVGGFWARVYETDLTGLSEDETNKIFAVRSYLQGDLTANAEHPMLMKLLCLASLRAAAAWNRGVGAAVGVTLGDEAALRLPNALLGALTVVPLFLFANALFGFRIGLIASVLWSFGVNSIWFNRIGKEDTLLVFFMLAGYYLYARAKNKPASDVAGQELLYTLSGAAFGLMLASKYFPHYYGFNLLYYHLAGYDSRNNRPLTRRMLTCHFAAMLLVFASFNFAAFMPNTWRFNWAFINEHLITHHGYLLMDRLYVNEMSQTPFGNPWYFYLLFLAVKLPLPVLVAFVIGAVEAFRSRVHCEWSRGAILLRIMLVFWLGPMSLAGAKWSRYVLALLPFAYIAAGIGVMALWRWASKLAERFSRRPVVLLKPAFAFTLAIVFLAVPAYESLRSLPYPSLYLNAFGGNRIGYFFPHDEFYDVGARESVRYIAENARQGASVASEIPGVVGYYLEQFGRNDIRSEIMSNPKFDLVRSAPNYVILQRGRLYIENRETYQSIERTYPVAQESTCLGTATSRVYVTGPRQPERRLADRLH